MKVINKIFSRFQKEHPGETVYKKIILLRQTAIAQNRDITIIKITAEDAASINALLAHSEDFIPPKYRENKKVKIGDQLFGLTIASISSEQLEVN